MLPPTGRGEAKPRILWHGFVAGPVQFTHATGAVVAQSTRGLRRVGEVKIIHYVGDALLTGDAIADAMVHYAEALALKNSSAAIDVPVRFTDGRIEPASFLLGPASQLIAVSADSEYEEIVDDELVRRILLETQRLVGSHPQFEDSDSPDSSVLDDLEYPASEQS